MAEFIKEGEMVDGAQCGVYTRKFEWKGLKRDPITNKPMTLYELSRNSSVEITKELGPLDKQNRENNIHTDLEDKLKADAIQLWVDIKRNSLKFDVKEGQSSTHGGQLTDTKKRAVGRIKYSFDVYKKMLNHSANSDLVQNEE